MKRMLFCVAMATTLMTSCTKNESIETPKNEAIGFGTYVGLSTKGADADIVALETSGFTVNGYATAADWTTNATPNIMHQTKVTYVESAWTYSPLAYWPASGTVTFFANSTHASVTAPSVETAEGVPSFTFTAVDAAADQIDCLAAVAVALDKNKQNGDVIFAFNHILSKIGFTAALSASLTDTKVTVTGLEVKYATGKVKNSGTYIHVAHEKNVGTWAAYDKTFHSGSAGNVIKTDGVPLDASTLAAAQLNADDRFLMIVPQTLDTEGDMSVVVTYTVQVKDGAVLTYTKTANISATTTFAPKTSYLFNIEIDLAGDAITFGDPSVGTWAANEEI